MFNCIVSNTWAQAHLRKLSTKFVYTHTCIYIYIYFFKKIQKPVTLGL